MIFFILSFLKKPIILYVDIFFDFSSFKLPKNTCKYIKNQIESDEIINQDESCEREVNRVNREKLKRLL